MPVRYPLHHCIERVEATLAVGTVEQLHRAMYGANSYRSIHDQCHRIAHDTKVPFHTVAAVTAVLSPIITWEANIAEAAALCGYPSSSLYPDALVFSALPLNIIKARRILAGELPQDILRGPKVWNFYTSIVDPTNDRSVCVDRHVCRAATDWGMHWRKIDQVLKSPGQYEEIADAVRHVAQAESFLPLQVQAALWLIVREGNLEQRRMF